MDSVLGKPEIPQSWNRYSYAQGNPLVLLDPDGQEPERFTGRMAQYVADPSSIQRESRAAGAAALAAGSLSGSLALARTAGPVLFSLAVRFQPAVNTLRNLGAALTDMPMSASSLIGLSLGKLGTVVEAAAGKITGFTPHGLDQVINRGVTPEAPKVCGQQPSRGVEARRWQNPLPDEGRCGRLDEERKGRDRLYEEGVQ